MLQLPEKATRPTMYFIGVTTGQSSIMRIFPIWAEALGIDACIKGIDITLHAPAEDYRAAVEFIKNDQVAFEAEMTLNMGQLLSIPFVIAGVVFVIIGLKSKPQHIAWAEEPAKKPKAQKVAPPKAKR